MQQCLSSHLKLTECLFDFILFILFEFKMGFNYNELYVFTEGGAGTPNNFKYIIQEYDKDK